MPAKRLPWVKLWPELMEREKVRRLTDGQYRTWTYCLLAASQLPTRWRFESFEHAAYVTRRPMKEIKALAAAHFLDERSDGVWVHDATEYQDVYPSDYGTGEDPNKPPRVRHGPAHDNGNLREDSANTPPTLREHSSNGAATVLESSLETEMEIETEKRDERKRRNPPSPPGGNGSKSAAVIDAFRELGLDPILQPRDHAEIRRSNATPELIAEVYHAVATRQYPDDKKRQDWMLSNLSVHAAIGWINGYLELRGRQKNDARADDTVSGCPVCHTVNWDVSMGPMCPRCERKAANGAA